MRRRRLRLILRHMWRTVCISALAVAALWTATPGSAGALDLSVRARVGDVQVGVVTGDRIGVRRDGFRRDGFRRDGFRHRRVHRPNRFDDRLLRGRLAREPVLFGSGPVNDFARDQAKRAAREPFRREPIRRFNRQVFVPFVYYDDDFRDDDRYVEPEAAPVPEPMPPEVIEVDPPDARGPQFEAARGRGAPGAYAVGQPLPAGRPHVALDWEEYNLPRPPAGQGYARFAGAVLLIDTDTRVVRRVLWPTEG